jgi:YidC/Oxa1 family membrane protein insertase
VGELGYIFNLIFTFPIFNALMLLYHLFGDFALAIIVLTIVIKLVLFPLTLQQLKSSKAMQALQPQIADIKKKYSKDQQAMLQATQALYKEYGVSPVSGCLPLFVQLPVLYGLFFAINNLLRNPNLKVINSQLYPFVPHFISLPNINLDWFTFISPAFHISLGSPDPTHILPILAGLATFVQVRMSLPKPVPGAPASTTPDPSAQSMKMMQYVMPVMITIFGWSYPAGLALYWTISSVFQAVQQFFVTGWGSLMVAPNLGSNNTSNKQATTKNNVAKNYNGNGNQRKERENEGTENSNGASTGSNGPIGSQLRTTSSRPGSSSSSSKRRQRSGSASARRRGSAQRSRG